MSDQPYPALPCITHTLGVQGWDSLDAVILAALATGSPLLLVGAHGTAKSFLVERAARALGLAFRHYNASLLNYDDLVGIPLPSEDGSYLRFVSTPGSIWEAEFIFFDEISRCRVDLQNKLFPIVHERRVAGIDLEKLQHRWAAMNPPAPSDPEGLTESHETYLGSSALDPALTDRFPFVLKVPSWKDFTPEERADLVLGAGDGTTSTEAIPQLVERCRGLIPAVTNACHRQVGEYVVLLIDQLASAGLPQSPRRARMLAHSILAVHAARLVLEGNDPALEESALLALNNGLPQTASEVPPSPAKVFAAHRQAWELSALSKNDTWRQILCEPDPVERIKVGFRLNLAQGALAQLVTHAIAEQPTDASRVGLAAAMFLALRTVSDLTPPAWETTLQFARRVLEPRKQSASISPGPKLELWRTLNAWLAFSEVPDQKLPLVTNFLLGGFPDLWESSDWQAEVLTFLRRVDEFEALVSVTR